jgi:hypothetical protein
MALELISEPLLPLAGTFESTAMGRGEPGLPAGFTWRDRIYRIADVLSVWKASSREGGGAGDLYLRRHCYELRMDDGSVWSIYFVRQTPKTGSVKRRWFLYTRTAAQPAV